jgi:hypothetical protein
LFKADFRVLIGFLQISGPALNSRDKSGPEEEKRIMGATD